MSAPINHQIIEKDGQPMFVVIPYSEYLEILSEKPDDQVYIPHEVVELNVIDGKSLVRSWREYKGLTQKQVARRMGITQASYAQMEKPGANLRYATLKKLAGALEVEVEQLRE